MTCFSLSPVMPQFFICLRLDKIYGAHSLWSRSNKLLLHIYNHSLYQFSKNLNALILVARWYWVHYDNRNWNWNKRFAQYLFLSCLSSFYILEVVIFLPMPKLMLRFEVVLGNLRFYGCAPFKCMFLNFLFAHIRFSGTSLIQDFLSFHIQKLFAAVKNLSRWHTIINKHFSQYLKLLKWKPQRIWD